MVDMTECGNHPLRPPRSAPGEFYGRELPDRIVDMFDEDMLVLADRGLFIDEL